MQHPKIDRLRVVSSMSDAELRSRANALPELRAAITEALSLLDTMEAEASSGRVSSPEMVRLAQRILAMRSRGGKSAVVADWNDLLDQAQSLAGSVLSQADPSDNEGQEALPLDDPATRALIDAQRTGQAHPLTRTVVVGPDSTGR